MTRFEWNYTTFLNIVFLGVAAVVYWAYRNRERLGGGGGYAKDPVCGMQVETANPGATSRHDGHTVYFCSDRCRSKFDKDPARYDSAGDSGAGVMEAGSMDADHGGTEVTASTDPVCGMTVDPETAAGHATYAGQGFSFCSAGCHDTFVADPLAHLAEVRDPVCGMTVATGSPGASAVTAGRRYLFCGQGCADAFAAQPDRYLDEGELTTPTGTTPRPARG